MLARCIQCNFNISKEEKRCPNCSFKNPTFPLKSVSFSFVYFSGLTFALTLIIFSIIIISMPLFEREIMARSALFTALLLSASVSLLCELGFLFKWRGEKEIARRTFIDSESLRGRKILISERMFELNQRGKRIDTILSKIPQNNSPQMQQVRARLLSAREVIASQFARYELQKQKIELVRLQNALAPYLFESHRISESEMENGLTTIEQTEREIRHIRQNLTRYDAIDFPKRVLPEKENFLAQLAETDSSCEKLRETLLAEQALHALQGIQPLTESLNLLNAKDLAHTTETFNIQTTLTDFSESFDELEREYKRLKAEDEVGQMLLDK